MSFTRLTLGLLVALSPATLSAMSIDEAWHGCDGKIMCDRGPQIQMASLSNPAGEIERTLPELNWARPSTQIKIDLPNGEADVRYAPSEKEGCWRVELRRPGLETHVIEACG